MPSHNGHRLPRTREARTTHDEPRHGSRSQGQPGPQTRTPHPRPVGSGPRLQARKNRWSGVGERLSSDAPHRGKRRPLRAPSCRPHRAQSQPARARAVGLMTGPHARTPRTRSQWVVGPGRTPERTSGRGRESAHPRTPRTQAGGAPPWAPTCCPHSAQSQLARSRAVGLLTGPHARTPRAHSH